MAAHSFDRYPILEDYNDTPITSELASDKQNETVPKTVCEICYIETGPFGPTDCWSMDFVKSTIVYESSRRPWGINSSDKDYLKFQYDKVSTERIINTWCSIDFTNLKKDRYKKSGIRDGLFWSIEIRYSDGADRVISGSNTIPDELKDAIMVLKQGTPLNRIHKYLQDIFLIY